MSLVDDVVNEFSHTPNIREMVTGLLENDLTWLAKPDGFEVAQKLVPVLELKARMNMLQGLADGKPDNTLAKFGLENIAGYTAKNQQKDLQLDPIQAAGILYQMIKAKPDEPDLVQPESP